MNTDKCRDVMSSSSSSSSRVCWQRRHRVGRRTIGACAIVALCAVMAGCRPKPATAVRPATVDGRERRAEPLTLAVDTIPRPPRAAPQDPKPETVTIFSLTVYDLTVPVGTVSASPEFWKHVNEQVLNVHSYDVLYQNGIRVGMARTTEWDYFRNIIDQHPATTRQTSHSAAAVGSKEILLREAVPQQTIFHLDPSGQLQGRTFDESDNLLSVTYGPAPRKPETIRVALCPVVRGVRTKLDFRTTGQTVETEVTRPERLFDCGLTADVPVGSFLVVAPSPEGRWPTSLGNAFLRVEGEAEQLERILLLVPQPMKAQKS